MVERSVVVYNVQRLFRPSGGVVARALDATPRNGWTKTTYARKVASVGAVLARVTGGEKPAILLLIEVENHDVVTDVLVAAGWPDMVDVVVPGEQIDGYDVAIAYDPARFDGVLAAESHTFNNRFATRDLLIATLELAGGGELTVCGTHWASRTMMESIPLRYAAAAYCSRRVETMLKFPKEAVIAPSGEPTLPPRDAMLRRWMHPVIFAGDLNDCPWDTTVRSLVDATADRDRSVDSPRFPRGSNLRSAAAYLSRRPKLFNPTWSLLWSDGPSGTYVFNGEWDPLEQVLLSAGMLTDHAPRYIEGSLRAHAPRTVTLADGGTVRVTTSGDVPIPFEPGSDRGVSDHLPLSARFELP